MFDHLADPAAPRPDAATREEILARAARLRRRRHLLVGGGPIAAAAVALISVAAVSSGSGTARHVTVLGGTGLQASTAQGGTSGSGTPTQRPGPGRIGPNPPAPAGASLPPGTRIPSSGGGGTFSAGSTEPAGASPTQSSESVTPQKVPPPTTPATRPSTPSNDGTSGVSGLVVVGPGCPVQPLGSNTCGTQPAAGVDVWASVSGQSTLAASTRSASDGTFRLGLPAGTYQISAKAGMSCLPQQVSVQSGRYTHVTISCDSGIR